jgi:hypothetical protein
MSSLSITKRKIRKSGKIVTQVFLSGALQLAPWLRSIFKPVPISDEAANRIDCSKELFAASFCGRA